ncbi:MAG: P-II family nitrogen regulator [Firmicutes bacterium]|nr:P-II family nitrogen regulator [Bacillota bacterium]
METASFLTVVINRSHGEKTLRFFEEEKVPLVLSALGQGTATSDTLDYLGLGESEKQILFSVLTAGRAKEITALLNRRLKLYIPGNGIAYTIPLRSFAGITALKWLTADFAIDQKNGEQEEATAVNQDNAYELIVAIMNRGYTDQVMNAARAAQARGGTVIHALGTGREEAEKFFGISIAREKDMVLIVTTAAARNSIIKAIVAEAGVQTKAHAIVFSLPVSEIAGIRMSEDD